MLIRAVPGLAVVTLTGFFSTRSTNSVAFFSAAFWDKPLRWKTVAQPLIRFYILSEMSIVIRLLYPCVLLAGLAVQRRIEANSLGDRLPMAVQQQRLALGPGSLSVLGAFRNPLGDRKHSPLRGVLRA